MSLGSFASKFIKTVASPLESLASGVVNKIVSGLPGNAGGVASSITKSLFDVGSSYDSVQAIASLKTDNTITRGSADYFAVAQKSIGRASAADIQKRRRADTNSNFTSVSPNAKIAQAEANQDIIISTI
jgi:hypothetical protein